MLPDEMEAEKNRKIIVAQADEIEILKKNVRDLQEQYQSALIHNKNLTQSLTNAETQIDMMQIYDDISKAKEDTDEHK